MSEIREKIMTAQHPLAWNGWPHNGPFLVEAFAKGLSAAADIAEAEVQRLEARVQELEEAFAFYASIEQIYLNGQKQIRGAVGCYPETQSDARKFELDCMKKNIAEFVYKYLDSKASDRR